MSKTIKVTSPYNEKLIKELPLDDWNVVDQKLQTAYDLFWDKKQELTKEKRVEILKKCSSIVESRIEEYAKQAAHEGGKPLIDSRAELKRAVQGIQEAAESIRLLQGTEIPMELNAASMNRMAYTFREPLGVVAAISAFNHPFNLIVHQVIPATAVGCPVVVKPASGTPMSCINLLECLYEAGLPKEWAQLVLCQSSVAEKMVTDNRVAFMSFIGSGKVGWMLKSKLSPGTHCALEHGGVAPVIVEPDVDVDDIIAPLVKGGFYHAGQVCVSVQKIFVHEKIFDSFTEKFVDAVKKLKVGDPLDEKTEVGPLITTNDVERVAKWVQEAVELGAELKCGGEKITETTYQPTVLLNPKQSVTISKEEVFGPVVCLYSYSDLDQAIEQANALPYSFQSAVFTKNIDTAFKVTKALKAKTVMINDHTAFRVDWMPFGGLEESGYGVGGILDTMHEMTSEKLFVMKLNSK